MLMSAWRATLACPEFFSRPVQGLSSRSWHAASALLPPSKCGETAELPLRVARMAQVRFLAAPLPCSLLLLTSISGDAT